MTGGMMFKGTPGPWTLEDEVVRYSSTSSYKPPVPIATGWLDWAWRGDDATQESKANARLIAAAPELLEALMGLLSDIEEYQQINNLGGENNHWQVISRAAIAKALGEQK